MATEKVRLQLEPRSVVGKKVKSLRSKGVLPATVYGKGIDPVSVQTDAKTFTQLYQKIGRSTLVEFQLPGGRVQSAFIHAVQRHPVSRQLLHADLRVVDLNVAISVDVPIRLIGENTLVEKGQATLNQQHATLHITALPGEIPSHIDVDISALDDFDKVIHVSDLQVSSGVTVLTAADDTVLSLTQSRVAAEEPTEEETPAEPELVRDERDSDEE